MNNKELILKRLLEDKHITIEEMFILNQKETLLPATVVIRDLNPIPIQINNPDWTWRPEHAPYYLQYPTCNSKQSSINQPSDYKMD